MTWHPDMPPAYRNRVVTGDARLLAQALPDESVDLVFTDPVYDRIEDYYWLGREARRVLRPDSAALVWIANPRIQAVLNALGASLSFVMPLNYVKTGGTNLIFSRRVFGWSKACLWFEKGRSELREAMPDTILGTAAPAGQHKWNKNPEAFRRWLDAFTAPGDCVWDPFSGSGSLPVVCRSLGRNFVAFEIDPETAALARERVRLTPEPLLVLDAPDPQEALAL